MQDSTAAPRRDGDDIAMPPIVTCVVCGRSDCTTCEAARPNVEPISALAWEGPGRLGARLWHTALATSSEPRQTFGELGDGPLGSAFAFAFLAEAVAVGSVAIASALGALAVTPDLARRILTDRAGVALVASGVAALVVVLVALHLVWGTCIELGAAATANRARWRLGIRFGLYACGWDLLTSPAGVLCSLLSRGAVDAWSPVGAAARAPRVAMRAYMEECRSFDPAARRRSIQLSVVVLGAAVSLLAAAMGVVIFHMIDFG